MRFSRFIFVKFFSLLTTFILLNGGFLSAETKDGKKIGLVLAGGGALGFAHVGVLKVLEENNIAVDYVAGTSMGSIVGAAYASGRTVEELEEVITTTDWDDLFDETPDRATLPYRLKTGRDREFLGDAKIGVGSATMAIPAGMIEGQSIMPVFRRLFRGNRIEKNFDELPIPFRAVTADIETGDAFIPSHGDLAMVVRASMAVPGFFTPVEIDGHLLVDGGIVNNVPVDQVLAMGADVVIVVDFSFHLAKKDDLQNPFSLSKQVLDLLLLKSAEEQLALLRPRDLHINVDVGENTSTSFSSAKELLIQGESSTNERLKDIKHFATTPEKFAEFSSQRTKVRYTPGVIKKVTIINDSVVSDDTLHHVLDIEKGQVYDEAKVAEAVRKVYDAGTFKSVGYEFEDDKNQGELIIDAEQKSWYNEYIRIGARIEDDFEGSSFYQLALAYRNNKISKQGYLEAVAEIGKNPGFSLEFYQHFSKTSTFFYAPRLSFGRNDILIRDGDDIIAEYKRGVASADLRIGSSLGRSGETSVGIVRGAGDLSRTIGDPSLANRGYDIGSLFYELKLDTLDRRDLSQAGYLFNSRYTYSAEELGGEAYNGVDGEFELPYTWGRNTLNLNQKFAYAFDGLPIEYSYTLGGFFDISGFKQDELLASDFSISRLAYYRRFAESGSGFMGLGFYAGATFEFSYLDLDTEQLTTPSKIYSGSVFLGIDTPLVPVYLGYGLNSEDEMALYFLLGKL